MIAPRHFIAVCLVGCAPAAWAQEAAPVEESQPNAVTMTLPFPVYATPIEAAVDLVGNFPESLEGKQALSVEAARYDKAPEQLLMTVTLTGLLDDSTSAIRYTIRLKPVADGWQRTAYKQESQCARGADVVEWKVGTCP